MRFSHVLPLAALSSAFVLPPQDVLDEIAIEDHHPATNWYDEVAHAADEVPSYLKDHLDEALQSSKDAWEQVSESSRDTFDQALEYASETADDVFGTVRDTAFDMQSWLECGEDEDDDGFDDDEFVEAFDGPHHGPPPPHHGRPGHGKPGHGRPGRGKPRHPPHHNKPNLTVYQMIAESKYTTKLAKLINEFDDLVEALNSTKANYTVFAPTDKAFEKIPDHAPKPSKEQLKAFLAYHVVPDLYSARRVLFTHTAPTLLQGKHLGYEPMPQRLSFRLGLRGLSVNFYSRIIAANIFGTNGVIHGVDSVLLPPPRVMKIIDLLPSEFSTLELGLGKTGLYEKLNTTKHPGGTFFAPSNFAFQKLGPRVNAFLFSQYGLKYLKALLQYHVVVDGNTLYSDAYYKTSKSDDSEDLSVARGYLHLDLPTLLKDRSLAVDVTRFGGFITMKINAFTRVTVQDGIAEDGVVHVVSNVIVPPKQVGGLGSDEFEYWDGSELSVEELIERLEPYVAKGDL